MSRTNKENKKDQLQVIFENMGRPDAATQARLRSPEARAMVAATFAEMDKRPQAFVPLEARYPSASPEAIDLLKRMPYANNFALAVQDIRDEQAQKESEAITVPELLSPTYEPTSPTYTPSSPAYTPMYEPTSPMQQGNLQQPQMMMMPQPMQPMQPMMMMPQPMMMMPQPMMQPMMMMPPTSPTSATGAKAAELIEEKLHPSITSESVSLLDVAPEVKPAESSSTSSESSGSSEGKRVIKLS
jgi:hypothetical protein